MPAYDPPASTGSGGAPSGPAGGQLAGTYPDPTVAASHSGSTHAATQTAAEATAAAAAAVHVALASAHHTAYVAADHTAVGDASPHHARAHAMDGASDHTTATLGDLIYAAIAGAWTRLAGNTTSTKKFQTQTGTGIVSAAPAWDVIADGDVPATHSGSAHHAQAHHAAHEPAGGDAMAVDAAAATGSLRTLGSGATQAVSGTDARLSDARTPTAHATTHAPSGSDPRLVGSGSYTPGSMTVPDGTWLLAVGKIKLTTTQALIAHGTGAAKCVGEAR